MGKKLVPKDRGDLLEWTQKKLPPYMTRDEVRRVLKVVEQNPFYHLLLNFLWQTGARITEVLSVRASDVDFYSRVVRMPSLKKREMEIKTLPIKEGLVGEIGVYIGQEGLRKESPLFPITRQHAHRIIRNACMKAGIEPRRSHPHVLRHSFAVNAVLQRTPLPILQKWLGHSDIKSTMVYLNILSEDTRDFYEAIEF